MLANKYKSYKMEQVDQEWTVNYRLGDRDLNPSIKWNILSCKDYLFGVKLASCQTSTEECFLLDKDSQQPKDKLTIYLFDANIVNVTFKTLQIKLYCTALSTNTVWIWWQNSRVHKSYGMSIFGNDVKEQRQNTYIYFLLWIKIMKIKLK